MTQQLNNNYNKERNKDKSKDQLGKANLKIQTGAYGSLMDENSDCGGGQNRSDYECILIILQLLWFQIIEVVLLPGSP